MTDYAKMQFEIFKMRAMRVHAEIVSGAYKQAKVFQLEPEGKERSFTENELLERKVHEMDRHIHFMQTVLDDDLTCA